ncbi:GTPase HflX [Ihubacter massiliensis]|uniref:GTPase HflX n=1 Tax=Hominibacterium faecale TaxID=2839743 RepID=A0A9J6QY05_9FIRM|nr:MULTISPECIES: GTPase HflX [Eubacteriales Family XIII. Incertae Sedis]MCI7302361.1 GTPase HflX [Clostridia bacterium]MCO7123718.1 GTPase HflX [Ihubacter massiliensis]MCU7380372.1 GTPase HflX [Hominibacterium faecale]MDY3011028.1 GTPase HflX [Clostridiales Family XIII bacterium]
MVRFNEKNEIIKEEDYQAILVGLQLGEDISYSMEELSGLAQAAGVTVLGQMIQSLEKPNSATLIGKGKVEELAQMCANMEADTVIFNEELSGMQLRNLEESLSVRVIDRTILILDIFAARATSKEGKLQVELAQLQYRLPRLTGFGKSLSRLGGGIGTRGPGEKKLETDRRHVAGRMDDIKKELARIKNTRSVQRTQREKAQIPVVALVGYTNSGKSALMNRLLSMSEKEDKAVKEKDMLFATLDTQQRSIQLENNFEFILIDTVGFVSKLPHSLVEAFKATLEEVNYADLLLHVVDGSYENYDFHIDVTNRVIDEIGAGGKEKIMVYNKLDLIQELPVDATECECVFVSAKYGDHIDELLAKVREKLFASRVRAALLIPYDRGELSSYLCEKAIVHGMDYKEEGTLFDVELSEIDYNRLKKYDTV